MDVGVWGVGLRVVDLGCFVWYLGCGVWGSGVWSIFFPFSFFSSFFLFAVFAVFCFLYLFFLSGLLFGVQAVPGYLAHKKHPPP